MAGVAREAAGDPVSAAGRHSAGAGHGPVLDPDKLLGPLLFPVVSLAVALILFEGSLTLRFHEFRASATWCEDWSVTAR
jgi:hypothetical protein